MAKNWVVRNLHVDSKHEYGKKISCSQNVWIHEIHKWLRMATWVHSEANNYSPAQPNLQ